MAPAPEARGWLDEKNSVFWLAFRKDKLFARIAYFAVSFIHNFLSNSHVHKSYIDKAWSVSPVFIITIIYFAFSI